MKKVLAALGLLLGLMACGGGGDASPDQDARAVRGDTQLTPPVPVALEPALEERLRNLIWPYGEFVLHSREEWAQLWQRQQGKRSFNCDASGCDQQAGLMPELDFTQFNLVLMAGETGPGSWQELGALRLEQGTVVIPQSFKSSPCNGCGYAQVQNPYVHVFLLPKSFALIRFEKS